MVTQNEMSAKCTVPPLAQDSLPQKKQTCFPQMNLRRSPIELENAIPAYNAALRLSRSVSATIDFSGTQPWDPRVVVEIGHGDETATIVRRGRAETAHTHVAREGNR